MIRPAETAGAADHPLRLIRVRVNTARSPPGGIRSAHRPLRAEIDPETTPLAFVSVCSARQPLRQLTPTMLLHSLVGLSRHAPIRDAMT